MNNLLLYSSLCVDLSILHEGQCTLKEVREILTEDIIRYIAENLIMDYPVRTSDGKNYNNVYKLASNEGIVINH